MYGMNGTNGTQHDGLLHIRQSVADILTTPIGSRVWRRDYGSRLPELIDQPLNSNTLLSVYAATADALAKWEPRFTLQQVKWSQLPHEYGFVGLILSGDIDLSKGTVISNTQRVTFDVALTRAAAQSITPTDSTNTGSNAVKPVAQLQPAHRVSNGITSVTLAQLPAAGYPVQMSFNGVLHNAISNDGATYRYAYDAIGDQITAYYYVRGAA